MKIKNVFSVFDGMSCGQIVLNNLGIEYDNYFASEIDKFAIKVTQANYPNTIQIGDIRNVKAENLPKIDLLIGGSPCQGFSFAGKGLNFEDPRSKLFFEFVRLLEELKPKYWLLENVRMKKEVEVQINKILGCKPYRFNSSLVSAQNRRRLYWTNIRVTSAPKDQRIMLKDILQPLEEINKKYLIKTHKHLNYVLNEKRLKKKFTAINPQKALTLTAKSSYNWSGNYVSEELDIELENEQSKIIKLTKDLKLRKDQHKASCLTAGGNSGGNHSDMDVICVAMRGRNIVNAKRVDKKGSSTQQRLEFNFNGKSNCITTVTKDNLAFIYQKGRGKNNGNLKEDKSPTLTSNSFEHNHTIICLNPKDEEQKQTQQQNRVYSTDGKSPALLASLNGRMNIADAEEDNFNFILRRLTPIEFERLQTVPDNYTNHVSDAQRYKMLGNGWTVKMVEWILGFMD